jgi:hypothetical protein
MSNMRTVLIFLWLLLSNCLLYGQDDETIIVKKGTTLLDYVSTSERYLYPEFKTGKVVFNEKSYLGIKLNYHYLNGEIEFLNNTDTMTIVDKKDLKSVIIAEDTFFYDNGYIYLIKSGHPTIGLKESFEFKDYIKKDGYGSSTSSAGSNISYTSITAGGGVHRLTADEDLIFRRTKTFYILMPDGDFDLFNKKNICKLFSKNKEEIKSYLKSNNIKFDSQEDVVKLAEYLESLNSWPQS